jgi:hypothetical protein
MYHSCMYIHVPCSYCTVTPLCASVARLVSGVVWYSTGSAEAPSLRDRVLESAVRLGVCCFKLSIFGGSHGVREIFDSLGFRPSELRTLRSIGMFQHTAYRGSSRSRAVARTPDRDAFPAERTEVGLLPALFARGDGSEGFTRSG